MIPTIETIIEDLLAGTITKQQAIQWLNMHAEGAANELRDYFAGKALTGIIANPVGKGGNWSEAASDAYLAADAMLAERIKP